MKKLILLSSLIFVSSFSFAQSFPNHGNIFNGQFFEWASLIKKDQRIFSELKKYQSENKTLPDQYMQDFVSKIKARMFLHGNLFLQQSDCKSSATGLFVGSRHLIERPMYPRIEEDTIADFEDGMIKIEAQGCLDTHSEKLALSEYLKADFQLKAIAELKNVEVKNQLTCEITEVFGLGKSSYCYNVDINFDEKTQSASVHTYNLFNAPVNVADAPVYFREILFTFKKIAPNKVSAKVIVYVRGPDIPGFIKGMATSKISSSQTKLFEMLNSRLKNMR